MNSKESNSAQVVDGLGAVSTIYGSDDAERFPENSTHCLSGIAMKDLHVASVVDQCQGLLIDLTLTRGTENGPSNESPVLRSQ